MYIFVNASKLRIRIFQIRIPHSSFAGCIVVVSPPSNNIIIFFSVVIELLPLTLL